MEMGSTLIKRLQIILWKYPPNSKRKKMLQMKQQAKT
jgi:hypothetical protein